MALASAKLTGCKSLKKVFLCKKRDFSHYKKTSGFVNKCFFVVFSEYTKNTENMTDRLIGHYSQLTLYVQYPSRANPVRITTRKNFLEKIGCVVNYSYLCIR